MKSLLVWRLVFALCFVLGSVPMAVSSAPGLRVRPNRGVNSDPNDTTEALEVNSVNMKPDPNASKMTTATLPAKPSPKDFNVQTISTKKVVAVVPHAIQLVSPPHRAKFTPGAIVFQWKLTVNTKKKKKFHFFVESLDGKAKIDRKTKNEKRELTLGPGEYRWRVIAESLKADSRWRTLKVVGLKSEELTHYLEGRSLLRRPSSIEPPAVHGATIIDNDKIEKDETPDLDANIHVNFDLGSEDTPENAEADAAKGLAP